MWVGKGPGQSQLKRMSPLWRRGRGLEGLGNWRLEKIPPPRPRGLGLKRVPEQFQGWAVGSQNPSLSPHPSNRTEGSEAEAGQPPPLWGRFSWQGTASGEARMAAWLPQSSLPLPVLHFPQPACLPSFPPHHPPQGTPLASESLSSEHRNQKGPFSPLGTPVHAPPHVGSPNCGPNHAPSVAGGVWTI